jgi:hypothetical protein
MLGSFAGVADYGAFVIAIVVFLAIPGPGNLALITSTGKGGIAGGMGATLGVIAGDQVLLWAAVAGVSALMAAYPTAFHLVQWLGAAYLAWLGAKMLLAKPGDAPVLKMKTGHYFRQTLLITLLNPKAIVFYLAFFPLFGLGAPLSLSNGLPCKKPCVIAFSFPSGFSLCHCLCHTRTDNAIGCNNVHEPVNDCNNAALPRIYKRKDARA